MSAQKQQGSGGEFDAREQKCRGGGAEDGDEEHAAEQGAEAGPGVIGADDAPGRGTGWAGGFELNTSGQGKRGTAVYPGKCDHQRHAPFDEPERGGSSLYPSQ